jgi:O-antigen/teichoic acid export membrane protein
MKAAHRHTNRAYFINIAWSWISVASILAIGVIFIPVLIRRLGTAQYGVWALTVSLIEYLWMIDLGFRPATVKFCAEFRARDEHENINRLINTSLAYSVSAGAIVLSAAWFFAGRIASLLHVQDPSFPFLIRAVGLAWATGLVINIFAAALEGFQRFDLTNRTNIVATLLRNGLSVLLVTQGYGLREMGLALLFSQGIGYAMTVFYCRGVHLGLKISPALVSWGMARKILRYTAQILPAIVGARFAQGANPAVIAYFRPVQFVTYFTQTQRIMDYAADAISRVGLVTTPRASDWHARGDGAGIVQLARIANRYCLTLWGLGASFLFVYGGNLCRVWINQDFGDQAAILLPILLVGYTFWMGQFISASVLMGVARYGRYATTLLAEAVMSVILMIILLPRFGLAAATAGIATSMVISRCLVLSKLFCTEFGVSQSGYLANIFTRPLLLVGISVGALSLCQEYLWPGVTWSQLIAVGVIFAAVYALAAGYFVVSAEHRQWALSKASAWWERRAANRPSTGPAQNREEKPASRR